MGVLDSSYIKALGVKSAGLKKIFLVFQDTLSYSAPIILNAVDGDGIVGDCGGYCEVGDVGDVGDYDDGKIDKPVPPPCSRKSNPAASQSPPLPGPGKKMLYNICRI